MSPEVLAAYEAAMRARAECHARIDRQRRKSSMILCGIVFGASLIYVVALVLSWR